MCDTWCRLCAHEEGSDVEINGSKSECTELKEYITKYLYLNITPTDCSPQSVCKHCVYKLKSFNNFVTQCQQVQKLYHAIIAKKDTDAAQLSLLKAEFNITNDNCLDPTLREALPCHSRQLQEIHDNQENNLNINRRSNRLKNDFDSSDFEMVLVKTEDSEDGNDGCNADVCNADDSYDLSPVIKRKRGRPRKIHTDSRKKSKSEIKEELNSDNSDEFSVGRLEDLADEDYIPDENRINEACKESSDEKWEQQIEKPQYSIFKWECYICDGVFKTFGKLQSHCRERHDCKAKITCICGKILCTKSSLRRHSIMHSNNHVKCTECHKAFTKESYLVAHMKTHLPKEELPYVCYHCGARYSTEARLRRHEVAHIPNEERQIYPCPHCDKRFMKPQAVDVHVKSVHLQERPFVCHECGRAFSSKGTLNEHLLIHTDVTPFVCQCGKRFKTIHRLKLHSDTHRDTQYQCPVCSLQLNTKRTLRQHLVIHKEVRAYTCKVCQKAFKRYKGLKTHEILHSGRRPYTCPFCDRTFTNGSNCRSHKRRMHPQELAAYEAALNAAENANNVLETNDTSDLVSVVTMNIADTTTPTFQQHSNVIPTAVAEIVT